MSLPGFPLPGRMGQIASVCQRFARKQPRSVLMTHRFSIRENVSDAGQILSVLNSGTIAAGKIQQDVQVASVKGMA
jgi:hypothetical protein